MAFQTATKEPISASDSPYSPSRAGSVTTPRVRRPSARSPAGAAVKRRERGSSHHTSAAQTRPSTATPPCAAFHPPSSASPDDSSRPSMPPMALPPTYRPVARPAASGCTSSRR